MVHADLQFETVLGGLSLGGKTACIVDQYIDWLSLSLDVLDQCLNARKRAKVNGQISCRSDGFCIDRLQGSLSFIAGSACDKHSGTFRCQLLCRHETYAAIPSCDNDAFSV